MVLGVEKRQEMMMELEKTKRLIQPIKQQRIHPNKLKRLLNLW